MTTRQRQHEKGATGYSGGRHGQIQECCLLLGTTKPSRQRGSFTTKRGELVKADIAFAERRIPLGGQAEPIRETRATRYRVSPDGREIGRA
jgi:hypothetical protein